MINLEPDYEKAQAFNGQSESAKKLSVGGHVCRIRTVSTYKSQKGNPMLEVQFDIEEGSEFDGFYASEFERKKKFNVGVNWPGAFRTPISYTDSNGEIRTGGSFKGLLEAVKDSNPGFKVTNPFNELTLQGKFVGFVFGEQEWEYAGKTGWSVKPFFAVTVAQVHEGIIPPAKRPLNNGNAAPAPASYSAPAAPAATQTKMDMSSTYADDDELPF